MPNRTGDDDQPNRAEKGRLGHVDRPFAHIHPKGGTRGVDNQCAVRVCRVMCVCVRVCVCVCVRARDEKGDEGVEGQQRMQHIASH